MGLLELSNPDVIFFGIFTSVLLAGVVAGLLIKRYTFNGDGADVFVGTMLGAVLGLLYAAAIANSVNGDNYETTLDSFEAFYGVSVVEGTVPTDPLETEAMVMFTQDGGPTACLVTTDFEKYKVVCDGEELRAGVHVETDEDDHDH